MPSSITVTVNGLDDLRRVVRRVADKDITDRLKLTNKTAAQIVVADALPHVPVRSGRLKASVRALASQKSGRAVAGAARAPHAAAIHWGRKRGNVGRPPGNRMGTNAIAGRPFLWDAARRVEGRVAEQYRRDIDQVIDAIRRSISR